MVSRGHCLHLIKPGSQGVPRIALYAAGRSKTVNSTSFDIPLAKTGSLMVSSDIVVSLLKAMSGAGAPSISSFPIPILDRVLRKMRSTELPVSIRILDTSKLAMSSDMTMASSCGLARQSVSLSTKVIIELPTASHWGFDFPTFLWCFLSSLLRN
ncbi:unnamed protein product [Cochlearia groenlandica]